MTDASRMDIDSLLAEREWLHRLARRLVADPATADDLAQDALVKAIERGGPTGEHAGSRATVRGWLATVIRRLSMEHPPRLFS